MFRDRECELSRKGRCSNHTLLCNYFMTEKKETVLLELHCFYWFDRELSFYDEEVDLIEELVLFSFQR